MKLRFQHQVVSVCAFSIALCLTGCFGGGAGNSGGNSAESQASSEASAPAVVETIPVTTRYGVLEYSDEWDGLMETTVMEDGSNDVVEFKTTINDQTINLFTLTIGEAEGEPSATITDGSGATHGVYVTLNELPVIEGISEGEQSRLYAMQEEINNVLDALSEGGAQ